MPRTFPETGVTTEVVTAEAIREWMDDGREFTVLDTRRPEDFETWHIDGPTVTSVNVPFYRFLEDGPEGDVIADPATFPDLSGYPEPIVTCCALGISSEFVAELLTAQGHHVYGLEDGMRGWARLYEYVEIDTDGPATVAQYQRPSSGCLAYLVVSDGEAAVIDPLRAFADTYVDDARALGAELVYAIDTHVHADHISGVRRVAERSGATVVLPSGAAARGLSVDIDYEAVGDGGSLAVGGATIEAIHTPGHTSEMTSYRVGDVLFTGDTLFATSVARPDLEEGDDGAPDAARTLYETLQERVLTLPNDVVVAPGHYSDGTAPAADGSYTSSLGRLRAMHALSMDRESFVEYVLADMPPRPANYEEIIATNLGQYEADDQEAFELELGPNNCAATSD